MGWLLSVLGGPLTRKLALWGVVGAALVAGLMWARWDAVRDYRNELRALSAEKRIEKIEEDRKRDDKIDGLGIDDLRRLGSEWVRDVTN